MKPSPLLAVPTLSQSPSARCVALMAPAPSVRSRPAARCALAAGLACAALLALAPAGSAAAAPDDDDQVIIQFLASTGQDADGSARARWRDKGDDEFDFNVELQDLPEGTYDLYVTDLVTPKGSITVDSSGEGEIEFATPQDGIKPLLDFPVLGQVIEVREDATAFFTDTFADGSGSGTGDKTKTRVALVNVNTAEDFDAQGRLEYESKGTKTKFTVVVKKLDAGTYTLFVDGVAVSELTTLGEEETKLGFQSPIDEGKTLLTFDPLGQLVEIVGDTGVLLAAVLPGANAETGTKPPSTPGKAAKDLGKTKADSLLVSLHNLGVLSGATGQATLTQTTSSVEFRVSISSVPAGSYPLLMGGDEVVTLVADGTGSAEVVFSTSPTVSQELLDFDVKGQLVAVQSGADLILATVFPTSVQAALASFKKETHKASKVKVGLVNGGFDLDATGSVQWSLKKDGQQEVRIDIADLPAGVYEVVVNDVPSASTLTVPPQPASGKAKLVFATVPKGSKVLLDFDPVDATVRIVDANDLTVLQAVIDVP